MRPREPRAERFRVPPPPEREVLLGASERALEEPAGQVLARLPWAGPARAGAELTAEEFFGAA